MKRSRRCMPARTAPFPAPTSWRTRGMVFTLPRMRFAALLLGLATAPGLAQTGADPAAAPPVATAADASAEPLGESWSERIVVTATRTDHEAAEIPLHTTVIDREEIVASPQSGVQDLLQRVPSIVFFEGSHSIASVPRDQSIGFRGLGGTAQSRSLVLLDGLPLNDPYGSSILWSQVPKETLERIEIMPGGTGIWGNLALSGVINLITRAPGDSLLGAVVSAGDRSTYGATLSYSDVAGPWSGSIAANYFESDGFFVFREEERGAIDQPRSKWYDSLQGRLGRALGSSSTLRVGARVFHEDRDEGTPYEASESGERALDATFDAVGRGGRGWQVRFFGRDLSADQFVGVQSADRGTETPGSTIEIPATSAGLGALWTAVLGADARHQLEVGADMQHASIERTEDLGYVSGRYTNQSLTEGKQEVAGVFAQDVFSPSPRWKLMMGGRFDSIRTFDGHLVQTDLLTGQTREETLLDANTDATFNPSVGAVWEASEAIRVRGAAYSGFRAGTPSELFVAISGTNKTAANPALEPERLIGGELGLDVTPTRRFSARFTGFWNQVEDLIERIEIGRAGPQGGFIEPCGLLGPRGRCRQRRNIGEVRTRGLEIAAEYRPRSHWRLTLAAPLLETEITSNPASPELVGNRLARTPNEGATFAVHYDNPRLFHLFARATYVGDRFDDNANLDPLPSYSVMDLSVSRRLAPSWDVVAGVENVLDDTHTIVLSSDLHEIGAPRLYHVGFRWNAR